MNQYTAIILAGGKSSRMGEDKGLMLYNGKPMIQHVIDAVLPLTNCILISANSDVYKQFNYQIFSDKISDKGPLGGIVTTLAQSETEINWVLSCDSPKITTEMLRKLVDQLRDYDAVVPQIGEKIHPLIAVYRKSILNRFKENLALNQLKMIAVLNEMHVNYYKVDESDQFNFKNLNSKADL